jgi:hypothetical protein
MGERKGEGDRRDGKGREGWRERMRGEGEREGARG